MFENLSERLGQTLRNVSGKGRLTEENIKETLREVRMALLEADVALPVVKSFVAQVKERAVGTEVTKSLKPGQVFIKIVQSDRLAFYFNLRFLCWKIKNLCYILLKSNVLSIPR